MGSSCTTERRRGFSLVELLVSIAVIAVLIALVVPSLRGGRLTAESTVCLTRLRGLGQAHALVSDRARGGWLNLFWDRMSDTAASFSAGTVTYETSYFGQVRLWPGGFIGVLWEEGDPAEVWTCPAVSKHGYGLGSGPGQLRGQPVDGGMVSYFYSAALISTPQLWDPDDPGPRENRDGHRRYVGVHEVRFPARKASMAEVADFHGRSILMASEPAVEMLNALFCDGHAARTRIADAAPAVPIGGLFTVDPTPVRVPFLTTPHGYEGADLGGPVR